MFENDMRQHCCCFTGHREHKLKRPEEEIRKELEKAVGQAIEDGYTTFITGMATGTDIWAGEIVLQMKKHYPDLKLIAVVPYKGFEKNWDKSSQERYYNLLTHADLVQYICPHYTHYVFQIRNEWMVDRSSRVIAVYNGEAGGTRNTIRYARNAAVPVEIITG